MLAKRPTGTKWKRQKSRIHARDKYHCQLCGLDIPAIRSRIDRALVQGVSPQDLSNSLALKRQLVIGSSLCEADHIVPLVEGGTNQDDNLRTLCVWCHKEETKVLHQRRPRIPDKVLWQRQLQARQ